MTRIIDDQTRIEMEKWMICEGDFVPLSTHVLQKHR
jgi:hypothetical protein